MSHTGGTKLAGIVGWPIAHSLSPRLHGFWLHEHSLAGVYVPLPVRPWDFSIAIQGLMAAGFTGVNVTVPHKQAAFALAHEWDEASQRSGASNLLLFRDGHIAARNTDVEGLAASIVAALGPDGLGGKAVVILGAGGAARAAILASEQLKARQINVLNRTERNARELAKSLSHEISAKISGGGYDRWDEYAVTADLVINATPAGMSGTPSPSVALDRLPPGAVVCDLIYNPLETPLLARARAGGLKTIDGLGMLIHQAVPSFEALYGIRPRVTAALRAELEQALNA